ncbi:MAG: conjugal transfer protein TraF [Nevskia sp.]|nr:conjugal transfer protein TraF [Nevskia sp.]
MDRQPRRSLEAGGLALLLVAAASWGDGSAAPAAEVAVSEPERAYFDRHAEGWFWYRDPKLAKPAPPKPEAPPAAEGEKDDPVKVVEAEHKALEQALDRAIVTPTPENVKAYLELNQHLMAQAGDFADAWRGAIWSNPSLDYSLVSPVGSSAYVKADQDAAASEQKLLQAAQQWGLVFFFRGTCPYCHSFAPLLKQFAAHYGFRIVDVSLDGGGLPEFPNPQPNNQAAQNLRVEAVPAVYLVNPRTRQVVPAVFGLVGWSDLVQRVIYALDHASGGEDSSDVASLAGAP